MLFLMFVALFFEIVRFIREPDFPQHLQTVIWVLLTGIVWANYGHIVDGAWTLSDAIASSIKKAATGSSDPFFLSEFTNRAIGNINYESSGGILTGGMEFIVSIMFWVMGAVFEGIMYLADMWGIWASSVAKVLGVLFVPLMMFEKTRPVFDGWVRFFCGFLILNVVLAITGVIAAITLQSELQQIGYHPCLGKGVLLCFDQKFAQSIPTNAHFVLDLITVQFLCIILVLSSFSFAKSLAASVGGIGAGAAQGVASTAASLAAKFL